MSVSDSDMESIRETVLAFVYRAGEERDALCVAVNEDCGNRDIRKKLDMYFSRKDVLLNDQELILCMKFSRALGEGGPEDVVGKTVPLLFNYRPANKWGEFTELFMAANAAAMRCYAAETLLKTLNCLFEIHSKLYVEAEEAFRAGRMMSFPVVQEHGKATADLACLVGGIGDTLPEKPQAPKPRGRGKDPETVRIEAEIKSVLDFWHSDELNNPNNVPASPKSLCRAAGLNPEKKSDMKKVYRYIKDIYGGVSAYRAKYVRGGATERESSHDRGDDLAPEVHSREW